jgi:hypothetical protein
MNTLPPLHALVYDTWKPWDRGTVTKVNTRSVYVQWTHNGETTRYDHPHARQFLKVYTPTKRKRK